LSSKVKQIFLWLAIISSALMLVYVLRQTQGKSPTEISYTEGMTRIKNKEVNEVFMKASSAELTDKSGNKFFVNVSSDATKETFVK
jgi:ATP-dependent Zn protease